MTSSEAMVSQWLLGFVAGRDLRTVSFIEGDSWYLHLVQGMGEKTLLEVVRNDCASRPAINFYEVVNALLPRTEATMIFLKEKGDFQILN